MTAPDPERLVIGYADLPPEAPGAPPRGRDPMALASAVLGIGSILFAGIALGPAALVTGALALRRGRRRSLALAWTGVATGAAGLFLWSAVLAWYLVIRHRPPAPPAVILFQQGRPDPEIVGRTPEPFRTALLAHVSLVLEVPEGAGWRPAAAGSGVAVASDGAGVAILTARHVVRAEAGGARRLRAAWFGGEASLVDILWESEPSLDLALVRAWPDGTSALPPPVRPALAADLRLGDEVFAVGDPLSFRASLVRGSLSALRVGRDGVRTIQAQIPLNPGNSGGGLYDREGRLAGIASWTLTKDQAEGMGFSMAIDNLGSRLGAMPPEAARILSRWLRPGAAGEGR